MTELEQCQSKIDDKMKHLNRYSKALLILSIIPVSNGLLISLFNLSTDVLGVICAVSVLLGICWFYTLIYTIKTAIQIALLQKKRFKLHLARKVKNVESSTKVTQEGDSLICTIETTFEYDDEELESPKPVK